MPIYSYQCIKCGNKMDKFHKHMVRGATMVCPLCDADMKLVPSVTGYRRDHTVTDV
jgi:putative FmdB family regulatory protein